jgi:pimeloyl-ACP methyl ester carboxylesterase
VPFARANGLELCYEEADGGGEPLVLVMGIGAQLVTWDDRFVEELAASRFRVIRFDNRDAGLSSKLDGMRAPPLSQMLFERVRGQAIDVPYTLADMADDIAGLLDALGIDSAHVVGASMGGMIAQTMALRHARRVRTLTSIMSHTGELRFLLGMPRAMRTLLQPSPRTRAEAIDRAEAFYRICGSTGFPLDVEGLRARAARAYDRCFCPQGFARQMAAILASGSRRSALERMRVPSLVIHGTVDPLILPSGGRATAAAIPHARLELIDGMGHDLPRGAWPRIIAAIAQSARRSSSHSGANLRTQ